MQATQAVEIDLNVKNETSYCVPLSVRDWQIRTNIKKVKERIQPGEKTDEPIAIVGFGPSLRKTWKELKKFKYIITCSGAHKFLLSKGIIPTYHLDVDPRPHKLKLLGEPNPAVTYLPASCLHPSYIDTLIDSGAKVILWHIFAADGESEQVIPKGEYMVTGGSDAGMRCMTVARFLGFTDFHIFGIDGSDAPTGRHADEHPNQAPGYVTTKCNGKSFKTTPALIECGKQVFHELNQLPDVSYKFYGEGLIQEMAKTYVRTPNLGATIAAFKPATISEEFRELNRKLHEDNAFYGVGGEKYAEIVIQMKTETVNSVLDYGCGKATLAAALPFPIWNYDPAIPEYSASPRPADLVICTDVLEHIEPDKLQFVFEDLKRCVLQVGYFVIHLGAAAKTYADGRNTHLIQESPEWWLQKLKKYFDIGTAQVKGHEFHVVVGPKTYKEQVPDIVGIYGVDGIKSRFYIPNATTKWRAETILQKEPVTIDWLQKIPKGSVLWDIGANVGGYSVWAGVRGVDVWSFEPEVENFGLLCKNLILNDLPVQAFCIALGTGKFNVDTLYLSQKGTGGSCHSLLNQTKEQKFSEKCLVVSGDDLIKKGFPQPDYIKLDVDGIEPIIITGMSDVVKKAKGLLIELDPRIEGHLSMRDELIKIGFTYDQAQVDAATRKDGPFAGVAEYVFYRETEAERHLLKAIEKAEVINKPFPHMYIKDALPIDVYNELLDSLPNQKYVPIEEVRNLQGYPDRTVAPDFSRPEWMNVMKAALLKKFGIIDTGFTDEHLLIHDNPGYKIGPHTDAPVRVLSAILYLAEDETRPDLGTSLFTSKTRLKDNTGKHFTDFNKFKEVERAPYAPNGMFVFLKTDDSFHGVFPTDAERDVLLYDIRRNI